MWKKSGAKTPEKKTFAVVMEDETDLPCDTDKSVLGSAAPYVLMQWELRYCVLWEKRCPHGSPYPFYEAKCRQALTW